MKVYLVKDIRTGEYSQGGCDPYWVKKEKAKRWKHIAHAKAHIREFADWTYRHHPEELKDIKLMIEEYEIREISSADVHVEFADGEKPHTPAIIYKQVMWYNMLPKKEAE